MKKRAGIAAIAVLLTACIILGMGYRTLKLNPFQDFSVNTLSVGAAGPGKSMVVVDNSGKRLFGVNEDGKLNYVRYGQRESETEFYEARDIAVDPAGNYYVLDIQRRQSGRWMKLERILKYSPKGEYLSTVLSYSYGEHEMVLKNRINRIDIVNGQLYYYVFTDGGFFVGDEAGNKKEYSYPDAELMLVDFSYDPLTGESALITKNGDVLKTKPDGGYEVLFHADPDASGLDRVPWHIGYDKDGVLTMLDIGTRTIYHIGQDKEITPYFAADSQTDGEVQTLEGLAELPTYYYCNVNNGLMVINSTTDQIVMEEAGGMASVSEFELSLPLLLFTSACWLSALVLAAAAVILLFWFIGYLKKNNTKARIIAACLVGAIGLTGIFSMLVMKDWTEQMSQEVTKRAAVVGQTVADMIPGDALARIDSVDSYMNEDYASVRNSVRSVLAQDQESVKDLYCVVYRIHKGMVTAIYSIEDYSGAVYPYDWPYEGGMEQAALESGEQSVSVSQTSEGIFLYSLTPIYDSEGNGAGLIEVGTNMYEFQQNNYRMISEIILNAFVIAVMTILIVFELLVFNEGKKKYQVQGKTRKERAGRQIPVLMTRLFIFVLCFAVSMPRGFMPIFIMKQSATEHLFGLSYELLLSIALSAEVLFNAIFSFGGEFLFRLMGRRKASILGSILFVAGMAVRAVYPSILSVIVGNCIMGAGGGILILAVQVLLAESEGAEKDEGFAGYTAASLSGTNCGVVFGAFLINWMNYQSIFAVIALISVYLVLFTLNYIWDGKKVQETEKKEVSTVSTVRFLLSPKIIAYYIGIVIPLVASGYFLSYLFPILASGFGISETNIGYASLLNGLCIICLGNVLTSWFSRHLKRYQAIAASACLYAAAFIIFAVRQDMFALLLTLVLFGVADGFGLPIQGSYYTSLAVVEKYGYDRSMAVYSVFENMSQVAGSFIFSAILIGGVSKGLMIAGVALLAFSALFMVMNLREKE